MGDVSRSALAGGVLVSVLFSASAQAFSVDVTGAFTNPSASRPDYFFFRHILNQDNAAAPPRNLPSNLGAPGNAVSYFGWGIDVIDSVISNEIIQSHFWFNGTGSAGGAPTASIGEGTPFSLGTFTYTNEQTLLSGGLVEIDFQMDISIDGLLLAPVSYRLEIDNTSNSLPDPTDTARLISGPSDVPFSLAGIDYVLGFEGFSRDNGLTFETSATLPEGAQTSADIYASITRVSAVPVPAAAWLFGSG